MGACAVRVKPAPPFLEKAGSSSAAAGQFAEGL
jgi:hypothetical protein